jgi:photosystem II stability/assembly factor-like uncharacterized protein
MLHRDLRCGLHRDPAVPRARARVRLNAGLRWSTLAPVLRRAALVTLLSLAAAPSGPCRAQTTEAPGPMSQAGALRAPPVRQMVDLTGGMRYSPPFITLAFAPSDPNVMYLASEHGYIFATKDGGQTWEETRVRTSPGRFFGAIRPTSPKTGPWGRAAVPTGTGRVFPSASLDLISTDDRDFREVQGLVAGFPRTASTPDSPFQLTTRHFAKGLEGTASGGGGGGGGDARLGVGLTSSAPFLQLAVRKKRGWAPGMNLKQTLSLLSKPPTEVKWISVNPENPDDAFAATKSGLLRTTDGGASWPTIYIGASRRESEINHVTRNPHAPNEVWMSTSVGLHVSKDDGETWAPVNDSRLATYKIRWVTIHPRDPQRIYVGTSSGMFMSTDGGKEYDWVFITPWPPQNRVRYIAADPVDDDRILLGTEDGLFMTEDGGKTFDRAGGLQFTGEWLTSLSSSGRPGHFLVSTWDDAWETVDGGKTWNVVFFGRTQWWLRWATFSPHEPGALWIVTSNEILKMVPAKPMESDPRLAERFARLTADEPGLSDAVNTALELAKVDPAHRMGKRWGSRWGGLVPKLWAGMIFRDNPVDAERRLTQFGEVEFRREDAYGYDPAWAVYGKWDLRKLVLSQDEAPLGRVFGANQKADWKIRTAVLALYLERRRLQIQSLRISTR